MNILQQVERTFKTHNNYNPVNEKTGRNLKIAQSLR